MNVRLSWSIRFTFGGFLVVALLLTGNVMGKGTYHYLENASGIVSIEAEHFAKRISGAAGHSWKQIVDKTASNGKAMQALPDSHSNFNASSDYIGKSPRLDYLVDFTQTGVYTVHIRGRGIPGDVLHSDSVHVGFDAEVAVERISGFASTFKWTKKTIDGIIGQFEVKHIGLHSLNVWMREDGFILDKIILSKDANYVPSGLGHDETIANFVLLCVEAENCFQKTPGTLGHEWLSVDDPNASGESIMKSTPDSGTTQNKLYAANSPRLDYLLNVPESCTLRVFVRGKAMAGKINSSNSCHVGLDGKEINTADRIQLGSDSLVWTSATMDNQEATITINKAGQHVVNVWMREDGFAIDKILFTNDPNYIPTDMGPAEIGVAVPNTTGRIRREVWTDIIGTKVTDITSLSSYPNVPNIIDYLEKFEGPTNWADNYGTRIRGYIHPPSDGPYTFWVAGDDNTELYLSTDSTPANKSKIAYVSKWSRSRQWTKFASQKSATIPLLAGQKYYVELLHKEGEGGDNFAVSWQGPGFSRKVIEGQDISPLIDEAAPSAPGKPVPGLISDQVLELSWAPATDDVAVYSYELFCDDVKISTHYNTTQYRGDIFVPGRVYTFKLCATDRVGNRSLFSPSLEVKIPSSPTPGTGSGLTGLYYNNKNLTSRKVVRIDPNINFDWGTGSPHSSMDIDTFSVCWQGEVEAVYTETYRFYTVSDDGVKLWVNGRQVVKNWTTHAPTEDSGTIALEAGKRYDIRMEYYENSGGAVAQLLWSSPSQPKQAIPTSCLYPSTVATGYQVQVLTPAESAVSPAWVEGCIGADAKSLTSTVGIVDRFNPTRFFVSNRTSSPFGVDLVKGGLKTITLTGKGPDNETVTVVQKIAWSKTNISDGGSITIRKNDSLLLTATSNGAIRIDTDYDSNIGIQNPQEVAANGTYVKKFSTPGIYTVAAEADGSISTMQVKVVSVDFKGSTACEINYQRDKTVRTIGGAATDLDISAANSRNLEVYRTGLSGKLSYLKLKPLSSGTPKMFARLGHRGPLIRRQTISEFALWPESEQFIGIQSSDSDSFYVDTNIIMTPKVSGLNVELKVITSGVTFGDSTTTMTLNTSNFVQDPITKYYKHPYSLILLNQVVTGPCHTVKVKQGTIQIGGE